MGGSGVMTPGIGDVLKALSGPDAAGPEARAPLPDLVLAAFWRDLGGVAPAGAEPTGPVAGIAGGAVIAPVPDLGALLVSSCAGCGGACAGHSVGVGGDVLRGAAVVANAGRATPEQMAAYLTKGYWIDKGEIPHGWDTAKSNVITVNLNGVSAETKLLVRAALEAWEAVADIDFREVSGRADITFAATGSGATTTAVYETDGDMVRATVKISESFVRANGTAPGSYSMQTCIHEIGHALGLGHAGGYGIAGGTVFANDSWQMSAMSYTSQSENGTVGADRAVVVTPMMADIIAVQSLYGAPSDGPTAGNTVYGKGATAGTYLGDVFAGRGGLLAKNALTIFDEGGRDRIDLSDDSAAQRVDLNGRTYSDVYGLRGNLAIAKGTVIEDYDAGSGSDRVTGNAAGNRIRGGGGDDSLVGRDGNDALDGGSGNDGLSGGTGADRLTGSSGDDRLRGEDGNDVLSGGAGHDTMTGGAGSDVFVFDGGQDVLLDFRDNADTLRIDDALFAGQTLTAGQVLAAYAKVAAGAVVFDFGGGNVLTLRGVTSVSALANDLEIV